MRGVGQKEDDVITEPEASESEDEDEGATKKQKSGADEEKILKAQKDEKFNVEAKLDRDGQPLYKKLSMDIQAKQTAKFGHQARNEGIELL